MEAVARLFHHFVERDPVAMLALSVAVGGLDVVDTAVECLRGHGDALIDHLSRRLVAWLAPTILVAHTAEGDVG